MDLFEAIQTCRAMRYLEPDPVPEELLRRVVHAATCAPSPGNSQAWDFVVVRDAERKRRFRDAFAPVLLEALRGVEGVADPGQRRMFEGASHLARNLDRAPALIFVCGRSLYPPQAPDERFVWSALYPAAQNLILAARALGLGTTFTTLHFLAEKQTREILGVPEDVRIAAVIPIGFPQRRFGPVARKPVEEVLHWERW